MGKGSNLGDLKKDKDNEIIAYYSWQEVKESKKWIVIRDEIYNVGEFKNRHPGGERILKNQIGQDCTVGLR
jgi:cytochrome b involved in lipid metabolism